MSQIIIDSRVSNGHVTLQNLPLEDETEVKIIVIPKANLSKMSFQNSQSLTRTVKGNIADDVVAERRNR